MNIISSLSFIAFMNEEMENGLGSGDEHEHEVKSNENAGVVSYL